MYDYITKVYGISQNPVTKDYIIIQDAYFSGNKKVDDLIQEMRLKFNSKKDIIFEWIPYNLFDNIEEIGKGDFATVYSAIWKYGPLHYNDHKEEYSRRSHKNVALNCLHNSQN